MPMTEGPGHGELTGLLASLRDHRARLLALGHTTANDSERDALVETIDAVGERLLVCDEELRVQSEHLAQSTRCLDVIMAADEDLFANAPVAYLQTDTEGVLVRYNHAARRLLGLPAQPRRTRTLAQLVQEPDRQTVRGLISRLRPSDSGRLLAAAVEPIEVSVLTPTGITPMVVSGRRSPNGRGPLHWELREHGGGADPATSRAVQERPMRAIADAALDIARAEDPVGTLDRVVDRVRSIVPSAEEAGVTLVRSRGRTETPATTGPLAGACDQLQHRLGEGPSITAMSGEVPIRVPDLAADLRWRRFAPRGAALGVRSVLALPLVTPRGTLGALSLYAREPNSFDDEDELVGGAFATHAGTALMHVELEANLRTGLQTREEIGRAVGILMERHRVTAAAAFDMLVVASQHAHRKLRDVASWMNETGEDPSALLHHRPSA